MAIWNIIGTLEAHPPRIQPKQYHSNSLKTLKSCVLSKLLFHQKTYISYISRKISLDVLHFGSGSGSKFNCAARVGSGRVGSGQTISGTGRVRASVLSPCRPLGSHGLMDRALDLDQKLWVWISAPAGIVHDWGETLEQGTEPPTAPRAPQRWLPTAPGVCALGWVKCRAHISLMVILCIIVCVTNKKILFLLILQAHMFRVTS